MMVMTLMVKGEKKTVAVRCLAGTALVAALALLMYAIQYEVMAFIYQILRSVMMEILWMLGMAALTHALLSISIRVGIVYYLEAFVYHSEVMGSMTM